MQYMFGDRNVVFRYTPRQLYRTGFGRQLHFQLSEPSVHVFHGKLPASTRHIAIHKPGHSPQEVRIANHIQQAESMFGGFVLTSKLHSNADALIRVASGPISGQSQRLALTKVAPASW